MSKKLLYVAPPPGSRSWTVVSYDETTISVYQCDPACGRCSCPGYQFHRQCYHISRLQNHVALIRRAGGTP